MKLSCSQSVDGLVEEKHQKLQQINVVKTTNSRSSICDGMQCIYYKRTTRHQNEFSCRTETHLTRAQ